MPKKLLIFATIFIIFEATAFAWNSIGYYTHEALAYDAIHVFLQSEYPALYKFDEQLKTGSKSEEGHPGGLLSSANGGDVTALWNDAQGSYLKSSASDFRDAYFKIGQLCHLTQDQGVPAHAISKGENDSSSNTTPNICSRFFLSLPLIGKENQSNRHFPEKYPCVLSRARLHGIVVPLYLSLLVLAYNSFYKIFNLYVP